MIEIVQRDNLFVLPLEDETLHLRYHHLFRDFLQIRIRSDFAEEALKIEKSLAAWFIDNRDWERAMSIYSRIGNVDQVSELIRDASPGLILGGRLVTLTEWIETLPESEKNTRPEILSIMGAVAMMRGASQQSIDLLDRAIAGLRITGLYQDLIAALIRRSSVNRYLGNYSLAMEDIDEALQICSRHPREEKLRAEGLRVKGVNLFLKGELRSSLVTLQESLGLYRAMQESLDAAKVQLDLGVVYYAMGNLVETEACYLSSLEFWQKTQNSLWQSNVLNNLGSLQHLRGHFEMAAQNLERAIGYARLAVNPRLECYSLTSLADLYREIRAYHEAHKVYELARSIQPGLNDLTLQIALNLSQSTLERCEENFHNAHHYLTEAEKLAKSGGSFYDEALCQLTKSILGLQEGKIHKVAENLGHAAEFFKKEGYQLDLLRTEFYQRLLTLYHSSTVEQVLEFANWIVGHQSDPAKSTLLRLAYENHAFLEGLVKLDSVLQPLDQMISSIHIFESSLTETRKRIRRRTGVIQFTSPRIAIQAFNRSQVKIGDHLIKLSVWKTQSVRDLFFFILQNTEGVTKEEVGEAFWPEVDGESLRVRFKNVVYRLRHALGAESLTHTDDAYRFNRTLDYDYDVENFLQEISLADSTSESDIKIQHYQNVLTIYRGPYLPKLDYEWVFIQREHLHQKFLRAATNLVNLLISNRQFQQAITATQRVLEIDPCSESAHRSAMIAYAEMGDRAGVVRQYDKCTKALMEELSVTPSSQTKEIYKSLLK